MQELEKSQLRRILGTNGVMSQSAVVQSASSDEWTPPALHKKKVANVSVRCRSRNRI